MSKMLDAAKSFAALMANAQRNCYWYGSAILSGGTIVPQGNHGKCAVPAPLSATGTDIGWTSDRGFALIGTDADQQPLAFTDCSGFVAWLVARVSPDDFNALLAWDGRQPHGAYPQHSQPWPPASAYAYTGYTSDAIGGNWSLVVDGTQGPKEWTQSAQPGDILAWNIPEIPGVVNDTGHVLILNSPIQSIGGGVYQVEVIDSSVLQHGNDSRQPPTTGVGTGTIKLQNTVVLTTSVWEYSFGLDKDCFHIAPNVSVLRLNV